MPIEINEFLAFNQFPRFQFDFPLANDGVNLSSDWPL